jgi:uncharacterized protein (TIGR00730 family)
MALKRVCVYCGSNPGRQPIYREAAAELGRELVQRDIALVYGGASIGVMGAVANAVLENGGEVIGVIPQSLATREVAHANLTELVVVTSMHERKAMMADLADGFVALPGGWGTFEELFEILTWAQLGIHEKPCGLLNIAGYYDHLALFLQHAMDERFVREEYKPMIIMEQQPETLLDRFANYQPPQVRKWIGPEET